MAVFLTYLLPLVLPAVVYLLFRLWRDRRAAAPAPDGVAAPASPPWRDMPWMTLALAGLALLALVLATGVLRHDAAPAERYVPPRFEGGRIIPGELKPEQAPQIDVEPPGKVR